MQNSLYGNGRLATLNEGLLRVALSNAYSGGSGGGLGLLRGYIASARALNGFVSNLSDVRYVAGNPSLHRLFSSEAPKKKSKNLMLFCSDCIIG